MSSNPLDYEKDITALDQLIAELKQMARNPDVRADAIARGIDIEAKIAEVEVQREEKLRQIFSAMTPWNEVQMARHKDRPYTLDYVRMIFDDFLELHGDRTNADDPAIVGGLASFQGEPVVTIGHQKGSDLKERQKRNFGSAARQAFVRRCA